MSKLRHRQEALCFNQLRRNYTKHLYVRLSLITRHRRSIQERC